MALESAWSRTLDQRGSHHRRRAQLNWIWRPDMRVNTAGHWTGTEHSLKDRRRSFWQQEINYRDDLQWLWPWLWGWQDMAGNYNERRAAGERWHTVIYQWVKRVCRAWIFSHLTWWIEHLFSTKPEVIVCFSEFNSACIQKLVIPLHEFMSSMSPFQWFMPPVTTSQCAFGSELHPLLGLWCIYLQV